MKLIIEPYNCLCSLSVFTINGQQADSDDFGIQGDISCETAEPDDCGNMVFDGYESYSEEAKKAMSKYKINKEEYLEIVEKLEYTLSYGECGWCI